MTGASRGCYNVCDSHLRIMKNGRRPRNDLKAKLVAAGISQVELGRRLGLSTHLNAVLNGRYPLTKRLAREIARELDMPVQEVMEGAK